MEQNIKGRSYSELMDLVNKKFNTTFSFKQIRSAIFNNGLRTGKYGCSHNKKPLYSEMKSSRDYLLIKVANDLTPHQNWVKKHRWLWEQSNGPIPTGHRIIFADQNKRNFDLDNLLCVSEKVFGYLNKFNLFSTNPEHTKAAVKIAELTFKIKDRNKELPPPPPPRGTRWKNRSFSIDTFFSDKLGNKVYVGKTEKGFMIMKDGKNGTKPVKTKFTDIVQYRETAEEALEDLLWYAAKVGYRKPQIPGVAQ